MGQFSIDLSEELSKGIGIGFDGWDAVGPFFLAEGLVGDEDVDAKGVVGLKEAAHAGADSFKDGVEGLDGIGGVEELSSFLG